MGDTVYEWDEGVAIAEKLRTDPGAVFVIHNAKFDVAVLKHFGIDIPPGRYVCSMVAWHCINPQRGDYSLESLAEELNGVDNRKTDYEQALINQGLWTRLPKSHPGAKAFYDIGYSDVMKQYCQSDGNATLSIWGAALEHLQADPRMAKAYWQIHLPFVEVMMSLGGGMHIDARAMVNVASELVAEIGAKSAEFSKAYPLTAKLKWQKDSETFDIDTDRNGKAILRPPNLGSPNDVVSLLLTNGWKPDEFKRETGRPVTTQNVLGRLIAQTDTPPKLKAVAESLRELRSLMGIQQQCIQMLTLMDMSTGIIHSNWHQVGTKTFRMSSSQP